jgi:hypothetical protein
MTGKIVGLQSGKEILMETALTAIELNGTVDEHHQLRLDELLPISGPKRVRVIVLYPADEELSEKEWAEAGARNPVFHYLKDPQEDIYSLDDGTPLHAQE